MTAPDRSRCNSRLSVPETGTAVDGSNYDGPLTYPADSHNITDTASAEVPLHVEERVIPHFSLLYAQPRSASTEQYDNENTSVEMVSMTRPREVDMNQAKDDPRSDHRSPTAKPSSIAASPNNDAIAVHINSNGVVASAADAPALHTVVDSADARHAVVSATFSPLHSGADGSEELRGKVRMRAMAMRLRARAHRQPRMKISEPPLVLASSVLDQKHWKQPLIQLPLSTDRLLQHSRGNHITDSSCNSCNNSRRRMNRGGCYANDIARAGTNTAAATITEHTNDEDSYSNNTQEKATGATRKTAASDSRETCTLSPAQHRETSYDDSRSCFHTSHSSGVEDGCVHLNDPDHCPHHYHTPTQHTISVSSHENCDKLTHAQLLSLPVSMAAIEGKTDTTAAADATRASSTLVNVQICSSRSSSDTHESPQMGARPCPERPGSVENVACHGAEKRWMTQQRQASYGKGSMTPTSCPTLGVPDSSGLLLSAQGLPRIASSRLGRVMRGLFCVRCDVIEQTNALHREIAARQHKPMPFLCSCMFDHATTPRRTFAIMCVLDMITLGLPCGCGYHGIGTALFGYRLRYRIRCRYRLQGKGVADFCTMMCVPFFALSQQECEMYEHGVPLHHITPHVKHMC